MAKITKKALIESVERLGRLRQELHALEAQEKELRDAVDRGMAAARLTELASTGFLAQRAEQVKLDIDVRAFKDLAGRRFLDCLRVDLASATKALGRPALERIARIDRTWKLSVSPRI